MKLEYWQHPVSITLTFIEIILRSVVILVINDNVSEPHLIKIEVCNGSKLQVSALEPCVLSYR